jgi:hypothetical protein
MKPTELYHPIILAVWACLSNYSTSYCYAKSLKIAC